VRYDAEAVQQIAGRAATASAEGCPGTHEPENRFITLLKAKSRHNPSAWNGMQFSSPTAAVAVLALLAGCATPPSRIQAEPVTDSRFANLDCPMLISERDRRMIIRDLLEDAQSERFRADVISGALTGLTQSMVFSPKAREARIAEVKGEIVALNAEIAAKECIKRIG
jgi:hypothetical protein